MAIAVPVGGGDRIACVPEVFTLSRDLPDRSPGVRAHETRWRRYEAAAARREDLRRASRGEFRFETPTYQQFPRRVLRI
jgi:hypothetical protein